MKQLVFILVLLVLILGGGYFARPFIFQNKGIVLSEEEILEKLSTEETNFVPTFNEVETDFLHIKGSEHFVGGALIDIDGDGVEEVFVGGGEGQQDGLLKFIDGKFVNVASEWGIDSVGATFGVVSVDGDLYVSKEEDVYFYKNTGSSFEISSLGFQFEEKEMPFSLATVDVNNDGILDLFVSTFIKPQYFQTGVFNYPNFVTINKFFLGKGDGEFELKDIGIDFKQDNFLATFVDLNDDVILDFVAATNTDMVKIYKGLGDGTFEDIGSIGDFGFWMGLTISDIDGDNDSDLFFTNVGNTIPTNLARGDLYDDQVLNPDWMMLRNDGDFKFTDVSQEVGVSGYEFAWGADFADFNNDASEDLIVLENYVKWPAHKLDKLPGRFLLMGSEGKFVPIMNLTGATNEYFGMAPLSSDFNRDGYVDLVYINLDGPVKAYLNNGGKNNFIVVMLRDDVRSIGAKVKVKAGGHEFVQKYITSTGLLSDQSSNLYFGLGALSRVESVEIEYLDGEKVLFEEVEVNDVVQL
ncbi:MAG: CRTAC1 family protein, partial [bacterium]|nr:CRTAC1 family protein [bacterium]